MAATTLFLVFARISGNEKKITFHSAISKIRWIFYLFKSSCPKEQLLIDKTVGFTAWKEALSGLSARVAQSIMDKINELSQNISDGTELFRLIYPFHVYNQKDTLPFDVTFSMSSCNAISAQIDAFDDRQLVNNTDVPMVRIVGEQDAFYSDREEMRDRTFVLKDTGHYPFFEAPDKLSKIVPNIEERLCQMMTTKFF